jgi:hypothetical protein
MRECQIGWIDVFYWHGWEPGEIPEPSRVRRAYEKKLAAHIIADRYSDLVEKGISVRIVLDEYDDFDGADISVYGQFSAESCEELVEKAEACIAYVPESHAFDLFYGSIRLTEDDFDGVGVINAKAFKRLHEADAREKKLRKALPEI